VLEEVFRVPQGALVNFSLPREREKLTSAQCHITTALQLALPSGLAECDPANYVRSQVAKSALCPEETGAATELTDQQFC